MNRGKRKSMWCMAVVSGGKDTVPVLTKYDLGTFIIRFAQSRSYDSKTTARIQRNSEQIFTPKAI